MKSNLARFWAASMAMVLVMASAAPAWANPSYERVYDASARRYVYVQKPTAKDRIQNAWRNPVVRSSAIGTAAGVGVGALTGKSLLKGGLVGAATGAGVGLMDKSELLRDKPLARRALKGTAIGAGAAITAGTGILPAAAIGTGVGAGVHYTRKHILEQPD